MIKEKDNGVLSVLITRGFSSPGDAVSKQHFARPSNQGDSNRKHHKVQGTNSRLFCKVCKYLRQTETLRLITSSNRKQLLMYSK